MLSSLEIIALLVVIFGLVKILVLLFSPDSWSKFASGIYANAKLTSFIGLILAAVVFYFLISELSIVQILAVSAFFWFLMLIGFAPYSKEIVPAFKKILASKGILKRSWLLVIVWLILTVYVLEVILL